MLPRAAGGTGRWVVLVACSARYAHLRCTRPLVDLRRAFALRRACCLLCRDVLARGSCAYPCGCRAHATPPRRPSLVRCRARGCPPVARAMGEGRDALCHRRGRAARPRGSVAAAGGRKLCHRVGANSPSLSRDPASSGSARFVFFHFRITNVLALTFGSPQWYCPTWQTTRKTRRLSRYRVVVKIISTALPLTPSPSQASPASMYPHSYVSSLSFSSQFSWRLRWNRSGGGVG